MNDIEQALKELKTLIGYNTPTEYMAELIKKVEEDEIALRKAEINLGLLKQMNNRARILVQATTLQSRVQPPFQSGLPKFLVDTLEVGKHYRHGDIIRISIRGGYTDTNAKATITKLANHGYLKKEGKFYIFTGENNTSYDAETQENDCELTISKGRVLKLLYLVYPNLNVSKLADAIGIKQPAVHKMIFG